MSDWTNLNEIMQDLSVAQGYVVPATLETYAATGPPAFNIDEEESEERSYYESEGGGGGDIAAPDYELIQKMLNMVKEKKDSQEDDTTAHSSDLDPLSREFVPQKIQKKIKRNVALTSIINAKEAELSARRPILKDVVPIMFKRKSVRHTEDRSESVSPLQTTPPKYNQYTPTTRANEYYSKYLEKSKLKEQFEEDIWSKAERQMKEIEARKKQDAELVSSQESGNVSPSDTACGFRIVNLPQHRHQLPGDCIVCVVASKHGYTF